MQIEFKPETKVYFIITATVMVLAQVIGWAALWAGLQAIIIERDNDSTNFSHILSISQIIGMFIAAFIPWMVTRVSYKLLFEIFGGIFLISLLMFPFYKGVYSGTISPILNSISLTATYIMVMCLFNNYIKDETRTTYLGVFFMFDNVSMALGPFVAAYMGYKSVELYYGLSLIILLLTLPFLFSDRNHFYPERRPDLLLQKFSIKRGLDGMRFLAEDKFLFFVVFLTCLNTGLSKNMLVIWGQSYGISLDLATTFPAVFALGGVVLAIPIGYFADKFGILNILKVCLSALIISYLWLSEDTHIEALDIFSLFIVGGAVTALFSLTMSLLGKRYRGDNVVLATSGFTIMRQILNIAGIYIAGESIDLWKAFGINWIIIVLNIIILVVLFKWRGDRSY